MNGKHNVTLVLVHTVCTVLTGPSTLWSNSDQYVPLPKFPSPKSHLTTRTHTHTHTHIQLRLHEAERRVEEFKSSLARAVSDLETMR